MTDEQIKWLSGVLGKIVSAQAVQGEALSVLLSAHATSAAKDEQPPVYKPLRGIPVVPLKCGGAFTPEQAEALDARIAQSISLAIGSGEHLRAWLRFVADRPLLTNPARKDA